MKCVHTDVSTQFQYNFNLAVVWFVERQVLDGFPFRYAYASMFVTLDLVFDCGGYIREDDDAKDESQSGSVRIRRISNHPGRPLDDGGESQTVVDVVERSDLVENVDTHQ